MPDTIKITIITMVISILGIIFTRISVRKDEEMSSSSYICLKQFFYFFISAGIMSAVLMAAHSQINSIWRVVELVVGAAAISSIMLTRKEAVDLYNKANKGLLMFHQTDYITIFSKVNVVGALMSLLGVAAITLVTFSTAESITSVIAIMAISVILFFLIIADTHNQLNRAALINYGYIEAFNEYVEDDSKPRIDYEKYKEE